MQEHAGGLRGGRVGLIAAIAAMMCLGVGSIAAANNLDAQTAFDAARQVARDDCRETSGCRDFAVRGLHKVSHHKAVGKIVVTSVKNGTTFECVRQIVVKLDHFTGEVNYAVSARRCEAL